MKLFQPMEIMREVTQYFFDNYKLIISYELNVKNENVEISCIKLNGIKVPSLKFEERDSFETMIKKIKKYTGTK